MLLFGWSVLNMQEREDQRHEHAQLVTLVFHSSTGLVVAKFHFSILCFHAFSCCLNSVKSVCIISSVERLAMPSNEENTFADVHPFLLSKWKSIFITFFDSNNSKEIDWSDFYLITKRVGDLYGVDSEQMRLTRKRMQPLWDGLVELADLNKDEKIQLAEWVDFLKRCENGQSAEMRWIQEYMNFIFQLFDVSCDGKIDFPEYVDGMKTYGVAECTARRAFSLITDACDHDHAKAFFDKATFNNLWKQYFFSKDKLATGNHLFGLVE
ncbi:Calexcitin-1 [Trichinella britovi]|uniref:Calexcitin-1 n=3 Tax=Trichinella TaxID=6333 RepID=A0A0V1CGX2_TRIBR|nr:Calexcitin-1 [Trichinella murrelli]KRY48534.1 Calexcitin-1 [Trichinella britovi]KRY54509.1 Calexcitin-1 [Trichinella britovi]